MKPLTPEQRRALSDALRSAFDTRESLRHALRLTLGVNLNDWTGASKLPDVVFDVVEEAERYDLVTAMVTGLYREVPNPEGWRALAAELDVTLPERASAPPRPTRRFTVDRRAAAIAAVAVIAGLTLAADGLWRVLPLAVGALVVGAALARRVPLRPRWVATAGLFGAAAFLTIRAVTTVAPYEDRPDRFVVGWDAYRPSDTCPCVPPDSRARCVERAAERVVACFGARAIAAAGALLAISVAVTMAAVGFVIARWGAEA